MWKCGVCGVCVCVCVCVRVWEWECTCILMHVGVYVCVCMYVPVDNVCTLFFQSFVAVCVCAFVCVCVPSSNCVSARFCDWEANSRALSPVRPFCVYACVYVWERASVCEAVSWWSRCVCVCVCVCVRERERETLSGSAPNLSNSLTILIFCLTTAICNALSCFYVCVCVCVCSPPCWASVIVGAHIITSRIITHHAHIITHNSYRVTQVRVSVFS